MYALNCTGEVVESAPVPNKAAPLVALHTHAPVSPTDMPMPQLV